jgi:hypothetical protein
VIVGAVRWSLAKRVDQAQGTSEVSLRFDALNLPIGLSFVFPAEAQVAVVERPRRGNRGKAEPASSGVSVGAIASATGTPDNQAAGTHSLGGMITVVRSKRADGLIAKNEQTEMVLDRRLTFREG